jgi:hypothetical protein
MEQPSPAGVFIKKTKFQLRYVIHLFCLCHHRDASGRFHRLRSRGEDAREIKKREELFHHLFLHPFVEWISLFLSSTVMEILVKITSPEWAVKDPKKGTEEALDDTPEAKAR